MTISKAADRFSKISIEDLESALASLRASTTESKAVSVECPLLKPEEEVGEGGWVGTQETHEMQEILET